MDLFFRIAKNQIIRLIILIFAISGCSVIDAEELSTPISTTEEANLPSVTPIIPVTGNDSLQSPLTANELNITVHYEAGGDIELGKFDTVIVSAGDQIKLNEQGRGVFRFGDSNEVNLFGNTEIYLDELKHEPGDSIFARFKLNAGHTLIALNEGSMTRVTLHTEDSTIRTLEQGTEFTVCVAPGKLTCIAVQNGTLEVISERENRILEKGEATYYTPGEPPRSPVCVPEEVFNIWLQQLRGPDPDQTLGQLVQSLPQEPCASETPTPPVELKESTPTVVPSATPTATETSETLESSPTPKPTNTFKPEPTATGTKKPPPKPKPTDTIAPP